MVVLEWWCFNGGVLEMLWCRCFGDCVFGAGGVRVVAVLF